MRFLKSPARSKTVGATSVVLGQRGKSAISVSGMPPMPELGSQVFRLREQGHSRPEHGCGHADAPAGLEVCAARLRRSGRRERDGFEAAPVRGAEARDVRRRPQETSVPRRSFQATTVRRNYKSPSGENVAAFSSKQKEGVCRHTEQWAISGVAGERFGDRVFHQVLSDVIPSALRRTETVDGMLTILTAILYKAERRQHEKDV